MLTPCYAEHPYAWQRAGHQLVELDEAQVDAALDSLDVLVLVNPNNPTGRRVPRETLLAWHARLAARGGWLLVDEAFMDNTPADSVVGCAGRKGLIVLRSFGKFFGLAGVRLGFVAAERSLLLRLAELLGPWTVNGPTRVLAQASLADEAAQRMQTERCAAASQRLATLLASTGLAPSGGCDLFQYVRSERAAPLHDFLARRGILVRLFDHPPAVRLGLPSVRPTNSAWPRRWPTIKRNRHDHPHGARHHLRRWQEHAGDRTVPLVVAPGRRCGAVQTAEHGVEQRGNRRRR